MALAAGLMQGSDKPGVSFFNALGMGLDGASRQQDKLIESERLAEKLDTWQQSMNGDTRPVPMSRDNGDGTFATRQVPRAQMETYAANGWSEGSVKFAPKPTSVTMSKDNGDGSHSYVQVEQSRVEDMESAGWSQGNVKFEPKYIADPEAASPSGADEPKSGDVAVAMKLAERLVGYNPQYPNANEASWTAWVLQKARELQKVRGGLVSDYVKEANDLGVQIRKDRKKAKSGAAQTSSPAGSAKKPFTYK